LNSLLIRFPTITTIH